LRQALCW